jgi:hypothetical protein
LGVIICYGKFEEMLLGQNFFSIIFFPFGCIICCGKMEEKLLGQIFFLLSFFLLFGASVVMVKWK